MSYFRPYCINIGCNSLAVPRLGRVNQPGVQYRVFCGTCHKNSWSDSPLPYGVSRFKTGICSNIDGHLGFKCVINWDLVAEYGTRISTEVDHINGDNIDNRLENLQELCPICHREKGRRNGDYDGFRSLYSATEG